MVMSYKVTRSTPGTPWLINALLALRDTYEPWGIRSSVAAYGPIPESLYCEWWYKVYGSVLTYEIDTHDAPLMVEWTVDFADEKDYIMFKLRWS